MGFAGFIRRQFYSDPLPKVKLALQILEELHKRAVIKTTICDTNNLPLIKAIATVVHNHDLKNPRSIPELLKEVMYEKTTIDYKGRQWSYGSSMDTLSHAIVIGQRLLTEGQFFDETTGKVITHMTSLPQEHHYYPEFVRLRHQMETNTLPLPTNPRGR